MLQGRALAVALTPEMRGHIPPVMKNPVSKREQKIEAVQVGVRFADTFAQRTLQWLDPLLEKFEQTAQ